MPEQADDMVIKEASDEHFNSSEFSEELRAEDSSGDSSDDDQSDRVKNPIDDEGIKIPGNGTVMEVTNEGTSLGSS